MLIERTLASDRIRGRDAHFHSPTALDLARDHRSSLGGRELYPATGPSGPSKDRRDRHGSGADSEANPRTDAHVDTEADRAANTNLYAFAYANFHAVSDAQPNTGSVAPSAPFRERAIWIGTPSDSVHQPIPPRSAHSMGFRRRTNRDECECGA